ncbi:hypothetical protein FA95DRAFT_1555332 [Auriscalpium vulgare]|uniref:Uncharacterized protein n=1 Tax=Auriscalpium vulgare TaxID=40419 RepID=A0ACB8S362_9AGAM|nr:hypothetical protein FA95DRAFT_1555332 [Auriscalpium vulgare]
MPVFRLLAQLRLWPCARPVCSRSIWFCLSISLHTGGDHVPLLPCSLSGSLVRPRAYSSAQFGPSASYTYRYSEYQDSARTYAFVL